jgi:hypothetical protein
MKSYRSNRLLIAGLSLTALVCSGPVGADITPPPGWVEECTIAKQQGRIETCVESPLLAMGDPLVLLDTRGNPVGSREAYFKKLTAEGYVFRCRAGTSGSFWTEIWCKPDKLKMTRPIATFFGPGRGTLVGLSSTAVLAGVIAVLAIRRRKKQP